MKQNHILNNILLACLFFSFEAISQKEVGIAKNYLNTNRIKQNLSQADIDQMMVSSAYLSPSTGWYHIYFNQTHQSVEVYNGLMNMVLKNDQVQYSANTFVKNIDLKAKGDPLKITLKPLQALQVAIKQVNLQQSVTKELNTTVLSNGLITQTVYSDLAISKEKINVKLHWINAEIKEGEKKTENIKLAWNITFLTKDSKNGWNLQVDAFTGEV